jgi:predicted nucleic acid-binding protein
VILDTNALSAIADNEPAAVRIFRDAKSIELPVIVLGEYRFGIAQSRRSGEYESWLKEMIAATRVLSIDEETSRHYARIRAELKRAGHPIPSNDLWIAALMRQHKLSVMSRDGHFDFLPDLNRIGW